MALEKFQLTCYELRSFPLEYLYSICLGVVYKTRFWMGKRNKNILNNTINSWNCNHIWEVDCSWQCLCHMNFYDKVDRVSKFFSICWCRCFVRYTGKRWVSSLFVATLHRNDLKYFFSQFALCYQIGKLPIIFPYFFTFFFSLTLSLNIFTYFFLKKLYYLKTT